MKRFFRVFWISLLVLLFLGTMVFLWMKSRPQVQTYELLSPQTRTIENSIIATGKVEPSNEVQIKPQISGIIDAIHYDPGEKKGKMKIEIFPIKHILNIWLIANLCLLSYLLNL